jgi:hypothetical protein
MTANYVDRQYFSRYSTDPIGLVVHVAGVPTNATGAVTVTATNEDTNTQIFSHTATNTAPGVYEYDLTIADTATPCMVTFSFTYLIGAVPQRYDVYGEIGDNLPAYDNLTAGMKDTVDGVWLRFADLFDSPDGGPNLMTYFQSNYSRGRVAQLLTVAVGLLNTTAQPHQTYTLQDGAGGASFPIDQWGSLLSSALYVECLKHLRRSYVEQPAVVGANGITRLDRRDYMDRWGIILADEQGQLQRQLDVFKIANMNLGRPAVLVSGGVYGRFGPTRIAGSMAARPRYYSRFY